MAETPHPKGTDGSPIDCYDRWELLQEPSGVKQAATGR
jgi:hypothetical protein